jgi:hypothetical protein
MLPVRLAEPQTVIRVTAPSKGSQDNLVVSKLSSLLELIGRARQTAAALKARLPAGATPSR